MGSRGPKAMPTVERKRRGTDRPDRRKREPKPVGAAVKPPWVKGAAAKHWDSLCDLDDSELRGVQERFKIAWLRAYMTALSKPNEAGQQLFDGANAQRDLNLGNHLKLLWLGKLLSNGSHARDTEATDTIRRLKDARLGWFIHFSSRWLSLAQAKIPERLH